MAIAGGAVPTLLLTLDMRKGRLKVDSAGSMNREVVEEDVSEICDQLQAGKQVYANATEDRLRLVKEELEKRGVEFILWQW